MALKLIGQCVCDVPSCNKMDNCKGLIYISEFDIQEPKMLMQGLGE